MAGFMFGKLIQKSWFQIISSVLIVFVPPIVISALPGENPIISAYWTGLALGGTFVYFYMKLERHELLQKRAIRKQENMDKNLDLNTRITAALSTPEAAEDVVRLLAENGQLTSDSDAAEHSR
jgi:hypothetical protein